MNHDGYNTSYLKNLLIRFCKASDNRYKLIDQQKSSSLDVSLFDQWSDSYCYRELFHSKHHSRHRRYLAILNYLCTDDYMMKSFKKEMFNFNSISELEINLVIRGY